MTLRVRALLLRSACGIGGLFLMGSPAQAVLQTAPLGEAWIHVDLPAEWHYDPMSLNVGALFRPPIIADGSPSLNFEPVLSDPQQEVRIGEASYGAAILASRQTWLDEQGGRLLEAEPYRKFPGTRPGVEVWLLNLRYLLSGKRFEERNYVVRCQNQVFFAGGLSSVAQQRNGILTVYDRAIRSFKCFM